MRIITIEINDNKIWTYKTNQLVFYEVCLQLFWGKLKLLKSMNEERRLLKWNEAWLKNISVVIETRLDQTEYFD